jgi:hypothetical protein
MTASIDSLARALAQTKASFVTEQERVLRDPASSLEARATARAAIRVATSDHRMTEREIEAIRVEALSYEALTPDQRRHIDGIGKAHPDVKAAAAARLAELDAEAAREGRR